MSTDQGSSGANTDASGKGTDNQTTKDTSSGSKDSVAYETYQKVLSEKKKRDSELDSVTKELQKLKEEKLNADGKKDELLTEYKKKYDDLDGKFKGAVGKFAMKTLTDSVEKEALKSGCLNAKALVKLIELSDIEVNEDFEVDQDALKKAIENVKTENPFMFSKSAPQFKDVTKPVVGDTETAVTKGKSINELANMLAKMN
jgi:hypothetical protein